MPHFPKPFFRPKRGLWYVQISGKQHNLGPDEQAAFEAYHKLMSAPRKLRSDSVIAVIDEYLDWCQKHRRAETYRWYLDRLQ